MPWSQISYLADVLSIHSYCLHLFVIFLFKKHAFNIEIAIFAPEIYFFKRLKQLKL